MHFQKNSVIVTKGSYSPLKCKAICHIILFPWNPNTSPSHLCNAVNDVLGQALTLGAQSVSFPVLGCGRTFKFPASNVAQIVISCMNARSVGTLQKVVLLAPDQELFQEFKNSASSSSSLSAVPLHHTLAQGATGVTTKGRNPDDDDDDDDDESDEDSSDGNDVNADAYHNAQITLINLNDKPLEKHWSTLKVNIKQRCLHVDHFYQDISDFWPKDSRKQIVEEAKKLCVWLKRSAHPKTKTPGYSIKGTKRDVDKMMNIIKEEFQGFSANLPRRRILSQKAPNRGTVDFLKHAASSDEPFPSYWSLGKKKSFWTKAKDKIFGKDNEYLVDVDSKTRDAIKKLISQTFDQHLVGKGADAQGLQHSGIQVISIQRVENPTLFEVYNMQRKRLFEKTANTGQIYPDIGKIAGSKGGVNTTEKLEDFMKKELYWEINEHYLFHGTKADVIGALINNGADPRVCSGMFGKGIYAAERATKSDQYTDSRKARTPNGTELYLVLTRMLLGNVFLCDHNHPTVANRGAANLTRPPCVHCLQDKCTCPNQTLFDSVMGDGKWLFREFIVYQMSQCYPEYIIKYKRV